MTPALMVALMGGGGRFNPQHFFGDSLVGWWDATDDATVIRSGTTVTAWNSIVGDIPGTGSNGSGPTMPVIVTDVSPRMVGFSNQARISIGSIAGKLPNGNAASFTATVAFPTGSGPIIGWGSSPLSNRSLKLSSVWPAMDVQNGSSDSVVDNSVTWSGFTRVVTGEIASGDPSVCKMTTDGQLVPFVANVSPGVSTGTGNAGIAYDSTTNQFVGRIGEILVVNRTVTTVERQKVEGYLAWKWGLAASLPAGHPWKNRRP